MGMIEQIDLLSINVDEAARIVDLAYEGNFYESVIHKAIKKLSTLNPRLLISITAGGRGSWVWGAGELRHHPAYDTTVVGTAGAGDAYLAGLITGLVAGIEFSQMQQLANLVAAFSVTSPHTIHPGISRRALADFVQDRHHKLSKPVSKMISK